MFKSIFQLLLLNKLASVENKLLRSENGLKMHGKCVLSRATIVQPICLCVGITLQVE